MPSPEQSEYAATLLRRARSDAAAAHVLAGSPEAGDDVVGFHAQQAVEKSLKAVLVTHGTEFPRTHDLAFLLDVATEAGITPPEGVRGAAWLTPWAAQLRYDEGQAHLDRDAALEVADAATGWAGSVIA